MRIVLVVTNFPKLSETFILSKFLGLNEAGYDVHIIANSISWQNWKRFEALKSKQPLKQHVHSRHFNLSRWILVFFWISFFIRCAVLRPTRTWRYFNKGWRKFGTSIFKQFYIDAHFILLMPDVIHFEFGALAVNRMYLKYFLKCKLVVSFRGYDINYVGLENGTYYDEIWDKADHLHFLGQDLWNRAKQRGCPATKTHTLVTPAINTEKFTPQARERDPSIINIVSVGRLEWKKGYEYALEAIHKVINSGYTIRYKIIGSGNYSDAVNFCIHQLKLTNFVSLLGSISHEEVVEEMQSADIFLHAAVSEGFCNAVLEAQAMKLPIVSSDADGLRENVVDGLTGFVVERRNPSALADKVKLLIHDSELRIQMGQAGRDRVVKEFSLPKQIREFTQMYETLQQ